ncbi:MAG: carboxymuconolactone decarboxylase family protein [Bacteroidales bacterium]|nr:carboxymuconolactone decarboxylase family protein [Bacteroidales bacterium]HNW74808.1 carboxymuconolactone decarboxylase family protein [Bacteroidales bacterium]
MALLNVIEKDQATGKVASIYENMINAMGFVPNAFKIFSASEHVLETQVNNLGFFMRHKTLSGKLLAIIRLLVSVQEECAYCVSANTGILFQYGVLPDQIGEIKRDPEKAPLDAKELALLLFILKVVNNSNSIIESDIEALKKLGWNDKDILEATYHAATQVGMDMIFNAFKIEKD